jgi:hypothetical protein
VFLNRQCSVYFFVDRCLSRCTLFSWSLGCLPFDLRILITPLVPSIYSFISRPSILLLSMCNVGIY